MKFDVFTTSLTNTTAALKELDSQLSCDIDLLMIYGTSQYDWELISKHFQSSKYKNTKIVGASSCMGLLTSFQFVSNNDHALGIVSIKDFNGDIGVGTSFHSEIENRGKFAFEELLKDSDRIGECPDFIWFLSSPGNEERTLQEIRSYYGADIQIFGGSCADNTIAGEWKLLSANTVVSEGVILIGFFSFDQNIYSLFQNGHIPLETKAVVTSANKREILELDSKPALEVLNSWRPNEIPFKKNESILEATTLNPIGRERERIKDIPFYLLSHPSSISNSGGIELFTDIQVGDEITYMAGSIERIQARVGEVVYTLLSRDEIEKNSIAGVLIVYCAGCMMSVKENGDLNQISKELKDLLGEIPVLGIHTFGEQGNFFQSSESYHGNLMLSVTFFMRS